MYAFAAIVFAIACLPSLAIAKGESAPLESTVVEQPNPKYPHIEPIILGIDKLSSASSHTMAIDNDGNVWTWGYNGNGVIGNGEVVTSGVSLTAVELPAKAVQAGAGGNLCLVLLEDGTLYSWGKDTPYISRKENPNYMWPTAVSGIPNPTQIAVNGGAFVATEDGKLYSWASSLPRYTTNNVTLYTPDVSSVPFVEKVFRSQFVVTPKGVYGWGAFSDKYNQVITSGEQKDGTHPFPRKTFLPTNIIQIESSYSNNMAVTEDYDLLVWGENRYGSLGMGSGHTLMVSHTLCLEGEVLQAQVVQDASAILKTDGTVWCAGKNTYGVLGIGEEDQSFSTSEFVRVEGLENVVQLESSIDTQTMFAKTADGSWWSWGRNFMNHQLPGEYTDAYIDSPVLIFTPEPTYVENHTVTVSEIWADGSQPDVITPYAAANGQPYTIYFNTPDGYTAHVEDDVSFTVDYLAGTISIDEITTDTNITIIYTPEAPIGDTHNVTVVVKYNDGAHPDEITTYEVADGAEFFESYTVQPGYDYRASSLYSLLYEIDPVAQTIFINEVTQDITVELQYERAYYNIIVNTVYTDETLPDSTQTHTARAGEPFDTTFEIPDGYTFERYSANALGITVDSYDKTIAIRSVNGEIEITIYLKMLE